MEHGRVKQTALSRVAYDCLHTLHYTIMVLSPNKQRIEQLARSNLLPTRDGLLSVKDPTFPSLRGSILSMLLFRYDSYPLFSFSASYLLGKTSWIQEGLSTARTLGDLSLSMI
jgi:hypothetical protein